VFNIQKVCSLFKVTPGGIQGSKESGFLLWKSLPENFFGTKNQHQKQSEKDRGSQEKKVPLNVDRRSGHQVPGKGSFAAFFFFFTSSGFFYYFAGQYPARK